MTKHTTITETLRPTSKGAGSQKTNLDAVAIALAAARSAEEIAAILNACPDDQAHDAAWRAVHNVHEQIAAHDVSLLRLKDQADMLRSASRAGKARGYFAEPLPF